jgi:Predicted metal-sulfur cluster biosynthetic enzyme
MIAFSEISSGQIIVAQSEVIGKQVPQGVALHIAKDQEVRVTQALGNSITVDVGSRLARIETEDLAKFGIAPPDALDATEGTLEERIWEVLKQSYDPEIPVNIVELGLIYDLRVSTLIDGRTHVSVDMTLTAPGCGMGPVMTRDIQEKIEALDGVDQAAIQLVFDPPWDASRMSEEARLEAGLF